MTGREKTGQPQGAVKGRVFVIGLPLRSGLRAPIEVSPGKLPRYLRQKTLKSGAMAYYWSVPTWAKTQGCPLVPKALGTDRIEAIIAAEAENAAFDRWRKSRKPAPPAAIPTRQRPKIRAPLRSFRELASIPLVLNRAPAL
jgi:hypothetical protein